MGEKIISTRENKEWRVELFSNTKKTEKRNICFAEASQFKNVEILIKTMANILQNFLKLVNQ